MTDSGIELLDQLGRIIREECPGLAGKVPHVLSVYPDEHDGRLLFAGGDPRSIVPGQSVLLFDSAVHSGSTMAKTVRELRSYGATEICTYALVLKRGSRFIPSLWGVMVNDQDRAYFLLDRTPNNRLTTHLSEKHPFVHLRLLDQEDTKLPPIRSGVPSMDRATWGDRRFDMVESDFARCTYLLEASTGVVGYLTIHYTHDGCMAIDEVAVDESRRKLGYGGVLLRFADTLARQSDCWIVRLSAIEEKTSLYEKYGYQFVPGRQPNLLDTETYYPMERILLPHEARARR